MSRESKIQMNTILFGMILGVFAFQCIKIAHFQRPLLWFLLAVPLIILTLEIIGLRQSKSDEELRMKILISNFGNLLALVGSSFYLGFK